MKATSKQRKSNAPKIATVGPSHGVHFFPVLRKSNAPKASSSKLANMARVRALRPRMTTIFTLANSALAFADANYTTRPQSAAVRLAVTFREIAAQLPADAVIKEAKLCRSRA